MPDTFLVLMSISGNNQGIPPSFKAIKCNQQKLEGTYEDMIDLMCLYKSRLCHRQAFQ